MLNFQGVVSGQSPWKVPDYVCAYVRGSAAKGAAEHYFKEPKPIYL